MSQVDAPVATPPVTVIPATRDDAGKLLTLKPKDFPRTREGRQAFFNYRADCFQAVADEWRSRATNIDKQDDPIFQKQRKLAKMKEQLAKLEAELSKTA